MRLLAQEGAPDGGVAAIAFLLAAVTGMVTAVTALIKAVRDRRRNGPTREQQPLAENLDEAQTRILREAIEALGDALEEAADERGRREAAEADAADWRDRYIRLLEGGREP